MLQRRHDVGVRVKRMWILGAEWQDGYLDYYQRQGEVCVAVCAWVVLGDIPGMFFERPKSFRMIWNYVWEIGLLSTFHKIRSRYAERLRNMRKNYRQRRWGLYRLSFDFA